MNVVIFGVQAKAWGPLEMVVSSDWGNHRGPMWDIIPSSAYDCMRATYGFLTPSGKLPSIFRCLEARNDRRGGALRISLAVALSVSARSSVGVAAGGG